MQYYLNSYIIATVDHQPDVTYCCLFQMFGTLPLHLRAVGSLLRLLERWLVARAVSTSDKASWHVPDSWHHDSKLLASQFEIFLKKTWDTQLFSLLDVSSRSINWWNTLPEVCIALLSVANAQI